MRIFTLLWRGLRQREQKPATGRPQRLDLEVLEDRSVPASVSASFSVVQDWGSGLQGQIRLDNASAAKVANWKLQFDYASSLSSIWDARIVRHTGSHYVIAGASWNKNLGSKGSVTFGFIASPGGVSAVPTNYRLNGHLLGGSPGPTLPALSIGDIELAEGNSGLTNAIFTVSLSAPSTSTVTVAYATADRTAQAGSDYQAATGSLTFSPGQTVQTLSVPIIGDTQVEPDETFVVNLTSPAGATLARSQATGTIQNDDTAPPTGDFQFQDTSDWGSGFTGQITFRNSDTTALNGWTLEFNFAGQITSIWNAVLVSHNGNHFVVGNASWNASVPAGGSISFGFNGSPGNVTIGPTSFVLNGVASSTIDLPPTPANDTLWTYAGQAVSINVLANDNDPDGDLLTVTAAASGQHGSVVVNNDSSITYTPAAGFTGSDSFTYTVSDGRGGTATASVAVTVLNPSDSVWPTHFSAPYVDMTLYPTYNLVSAAQNQGLKFFTLAFIVADSSNHPAWGGYSAYEVNGSDFDTQIRTQIAGVRGLGGDVMVSFGGANGQELAQAITNVSALKAVYQTVIDAYHLTRLDFDIEGAAVADHASIDRRSQALAALQADADAAGQTLQIWLTLPVLPTGLDNNGFYVVQSALHYGVHLEGVNVMAMDYGEWAAPNPQGHMGDYAIQAATATFSQLKGLYGSALTDSKLWQMIGVTPMIGINDDTLEVFDQTAARQLLAFAEQVGMGRLSFWSLNRDQENPHGAITYAESTSSSLVQQPFEFALIFQGITS